MNILIAHNYYQIAGGEDTVLQNEIELLQSRGESVQKYTVNNSSIKSLMDKTKITLSVPFSYKYFQKLKSCLKNNSPDIVHVHNYFPIFSPSIFYACKKLGIPVVHTLHNYRAVCPTATLMHQAKIKELSIRRSSWWTVRKKVYRGSWIGTLSLALMVELHKRIGTWHSKVDRFIALTEFSRQKYIEAGWPKDKVVVKPNFIEDPFNKETLVEKSGGYALFVGRLSEEKGIDILLDAWKKISLPLKIIGDGPLMASVEKASLPQVEYLGLKEKKEVLTLIQHADFIVMPSTWYEGFPMVLVEAFACGTSAIVSKLGSMEEIVKDEVTGLHFEAGNSNDLVKKAHWMIENPDKSRAMGVNARYEYLAKYTPEKNYEMLMAIYQQAIQATLQVK